MVKNWLLQQKIDFCSHLKMLCHILLSKLLQQPVFSFMMDMKPSFDSFLRVTPRYKDIKQQDSSIDTQLGSDKFLLLPATYILKSHDATALTDKVKVPVKTASSTILKTDKCEKQHDFSSKIVYCSSSKNIVKASYCDNDKSSKQPMISIKCIPASKDSSTRVISTKISKDKTNYSIHLESKLKKDSAYKISQSTDSSKTSIKKMFCKEALSKQSFSHEKSKPTDCKHPKKAKADLKINILCFPGIKDLSQITRKDDFDPFEIPSSLKKLSKRDKKQRCSSCCQPGRSKDVSDGKDFFPTKILTLGIKSSPIGKRLDSQHPSKQILRAEITQIESAKSDKAPACQKSAVAYKRPCLTPEVSRGISDLPSSQELLARYGKDIPVYQLEKYEACRAKRNGLQDECIPPLLQAILRREQQERTSDKCSKEKQYVDQDKTSEMKFLLYVE